MSRRIVFGRIGVTSPFRFCLGCSRRMRKVVKSSRLTRSIGLARSSGISRASIGTSCCARYQSFPAFFSALT